MKVADVLAMKSPLLITIKPTDTVGALSGLLREKRIGAAVVSRDGQSIDGVISERDIAYGLSTHGAGLDTLPVSALMTKAVITCSSADPIAQVASTMLSRKIRHVPVVEGNLLVGMVSMRDVLNCRIDELQQQTAQLYGLVNHAKPAPQDRE